MTPTLPDILQGFSTTLMTPLPPEASGDYMAGRTGLLVMLSALSAQEAERGPAARLWENRALRALFTRTAAAYDAALRGQLAEAAGASDQDETWSALDGANAQLRRALIALHTEVEARGDAVLDREILDLYQAMAAARRLDLPASLGG